MSQPATAPSPPPKNPDRYSTTDTSFGHTNPLSAFYQHPSTRSSLERAKADSRTHLPLPSNESGPEPPKILITKQSDDDLEKQETNDSRSSIDNSPPPVYSLVKSNTNNGNMWPTRQELKENALKSKNERMRKKWNCFGGLTPRQRFWLRIVLALLVIGAAVGIGVGISLAVGGGVYKSDGQHSQIPNRKRN